MIRIEWNVAGSRLVAIEPTTAELALHAPALSEGYNHPTNAELMGHTRPIAPAEVVESYTESIAAGMRAFLLFVDDALAGDGDLRNLRRIDRIGAAEFAFMIATPAAQGKGLGTKFATMIHTFGFRQLQLDRVYASVVPHNTASKRVFEKLGYVVDASPEARAYAEEPADIVLSLERDAFLRVNPVNEIKIGDR